MGGASHQSLVLNCSTKQLIHSGFFDLEQHPYETRNHCLNKYFFTIRVLPTINVNLSVHLQSFSFGSI